MLDLMCNSSRSSAFMSQQDEDCGEFDFRKRLILLVVRLLGLIGYIEGWKKCYNVLREKEYLEWH